MAGLASGLSWDRLARIRLPRPWRGALTWGIVLAGVALAALLRPEIIAGSGAPAA